MYITIYNKINYKYCDCYRCETMRRIHLFLISMCVRIMDVCIVND